MSVRDLTQTRLQKGRGRYWLVETDAAELRLYE